ncbi:hypothetical protein BC835DRAFT_662266 [Cytidiella melzeri]|nr:hypothetical protein BC835DRAFT_662266 [Cytidiella melzeri]
MVKISPLSVPFVKWHTIPPVDTAGYDLTGKTVLLVGGCSGIGYEISRHLVKLNPAVLVVTGRNPSVGKAVVSELRQIAGNSTVEFMQLDLASFASVSNAACQFSEKWPNGLDVLMCNSGTMTRIYSSTEDGWESSLQVNHLSTTLLTLLLLPSLARSPEPRIVLTTSDAHGMLKNTSELQGTHVLRKLSDKDYCAQSRTAMDDRYGITKMFNIFTAHTLASRLSHIKHAADSNIPKFTVVSANPGFTRSGLMDEFRAIGVVVRLLLTFLIWLCARTTEEGSRTILHAALLPPSNSINGKYFSNGRVEEESDYVISSEGRAVEKVIWDETIDILCAVDSRVADIVKVY